jgi:hypothetical protein
MYIPNSITYNLDHLKAGGGKKSLKKNHKGIDKLKNLSYLCIILTGYQSKAIEKKDEKKSSQSLTSLKKHLIFVGY